MALAVASVTGTNFDGGGTAHACALPATINVGDLLIACLGWPTTTTSVSATDSTSDAWTRIEAGAITEAANLAVFAKIAHGDEDGGTVGITTGGSEDASASVYRITGFTGTIADDIDIGAKVTGTADANPGSVTAGWGSDANLFIVFSLLNNNEPVNTNPANYTEGYEVVDAGVDHVFWTGYRLLTAISDDPGTIDYADADAGDIWATYTLVVGPQGGSTVVEGQAALNVAVTLVATGTRIRHGQAALSVSVTTGGGAFQRTVHGDAALGSTVTLGNTTVRKIAKGASALAAAITLAVTGNKVPKRGEAALSSSVSLAAEGKHIGTGQSALSSTVSLASAGKLTSKGAATPSISVTITASGDIEGQRDTHSPFWAGTIPGKYRQNVKKFWKDARNKHLPKREV